MLIATVGIYFLETGIIGLQLLGYSGWVQDAFYGAGLVAAVTVAHLVRNRTRVALGRPGPTELGHSAIHQGRHRARSAAGRPPARWDG
jgi:hypothetical protein